MIATAEAFDLFPLPAGAKMPPPEGVTGYTGDSTWREDWADHTGNWGARLHPGYIGLDIDGADHGEGKIGPESIAALEADIGDLPTTAWSTRHGAESETRILLFRIPEGVVLTEKPLEGVEIIQHHHRYIACAPSIVEGKPYAWYDWLGQTDGPESVADLPEAWIEYLRGDSHEPLHIASTDEVQAFLDGLPADGMGPRTLGALEAVEARGGNDSELMWKVVRGVGAIHEDGSREAFDLLHDSLEGSYSAEYGDVAWDRQWRRALEKAVGKITPTVAEAPQETPVVGAKSRGRLRVTRASDITPLRAVWLHDQWIPLGELTLLAGPGGQGKSTYLYDLAARVSRGQLDGEFTGKPRGVLVAATEDSWEHTIVPRLIAAGADLERIVRVDVTEAGGLTFPRDNDDLEALAEQEEAALLILDPLLSRLGAKDTHKDAEVRQSLEPVIEIAHRAKFAVVGIIHLNKNEGAKRIVDRITASGAFVALARSVMTVIPDPNDETERTKLLGLVKANLTDLSSTGTQTFTVDSAEVTLFDPWTGESTTGKIGRIVRGAHRESTLQSAYEDGKQDDESRSSQSLCAEFIRKYLTNRGPSRPGDVFTAATEMDAKWGERMCRRARSEVPGLVVEGSGPGTIWKLDK